MCVCVCVCVCIAHYLGTQYANWDILLDKVSPMAAWVPQLGAWRNQYEPARSQQI
jgi:hypothetical protein